MGEIAVKAQGICKTYRAGIFKKRETKALLGIDLEVRKGELFGILGPNGAGKTTFLNIIMGILARDCGSLCILEQDIEHGFPEMLKMRMNMSSGNANFPWSMTVRENIIFYGKLYGMQGKPLANKTDELMEFVSLEKYRDKRFDELSTGNKQKLALAKSLINDPELLLLDEPTTGMDPDISARIRAMVKDINKKRGITILLTTHYMKEAEELCGRIAFIKGGAISALGTKEELQTLVNAKDMEEAFIELAAEE